MAEINQNNAQKSTSGKVRVKKLSTRVDMTPMVDLAFLLLTFFILTATFNKFRVMDVDMPHPVEDQSQLQPVNEKDVLNLVLAEDNKIYYWMGITPPAEITNYSKDGVRKLLLEKQRLRPKLVVLLKPKDNCKYENMVDILDEIFITKMKRYAIVDFTEDDRQIISGTASGHSFK